METLDLFPWKLQIDKEKTSIYYLEHDLSENKMLNDTLEEILDLQTLTFIRNFGVDLHKSRVCYIPGIHDIENESLCSKNHYSLEFFFVGKFEAIPSTQWDLYFKGIDDDPAIFDPDENSPERIPYNQFFHIHESADKQGLYKFSPAAAYDETIECWDSGLIFCKALFMLES